jgi:hypothetical protein
MENSLKKCFFLLKPSQIPTQSYYSKKIIG